MNWIANILYNYDASLRVFVESSGRPERHALLIARYVLWLPASFAKPPTLLEGESLKVVERTVHLYTDIFIENYPRERTIGLPGVFDERR